MITVGELFVDTVRKIFRLFSLCVLTFSGISYILIM
jgi:hypothetical protein